MRDHALRIAGRARRVGHRDRVPLVARAAEPGKRRMCGQQCFVLVRADTLARAGVLAVADVDDHGCAPMPLAQQAQGFGHRRRQLAVGDEHGRLAVVHLPGQQASVETGVERVQDAVQRRHGVVHLDHLGRVVQHGADCRAPADAERRQRRSQAGGTIARLAPAVAATAVHDGLEIAEHLGAPLDEADRRERHEVRCGLVETVVVDARHGAWFRCRTRRRAAPGRCPRGCRRCARDRPRCGPCRA